VREEAETGNNEKSSKKGYKYTLEHTTIALWKAFALALGKHADDPKERYKVPDAQPGLSYGTHRIELSATSSEERSSIMAEYREFTSFLSRLATTEQLVKLWKEVEEAQSHMEMIASKKLKSGDIFYVYMFCRHLWT
jgi:hypothetical protein